MIRMFCGRFDVMVDKKWRVAIPSYWKRYMEGVVYITVGSNNCLQIYAQNEFLRESLPNVFEVPVRDGKKSKQKRIIIPEPLRDSISFYFGREMTLAGYEDYFEIWPRFSQL